MPVKYILVTVQCDEDLSDLLIAEMSEIGYDAFASQENGFQASVTATEFDRDVLEKLFRRHKTQGFITFHSEELEDKNWNELWEKSYEPVNIRDRCLIRASFHKPLKFYPIEIVINPKMSFGTGHHETTRLMIETQLGTDHGGKSVLDMGCGTGILSILAEKLGADKILGLDIDPWALENALENIRLNECEKVDIRKARIEDLDEQASFDIILANINRHIIMQDTGRYAGLLKEKGMFVCSGFLETDGDMIIGEAKKYSLDYLSGRIMDKWMVLVFEKNSLNFNP